MKPRADITDTRPLQLRLRDPPQTLDRRFRTGRRRTRGNASSLFNRSLLIKRLLPNGSHRLRGIRCDARLRGSRLQR
ncbi:hypothetical protein, partial [Burkholderia pseudomallei]